MNGVFFAGQPAVLDYNRTVEDFVSQRWPESRWPTALSRLTGRQEGSPFLPDVLQWSKIPYPDVPCPRLNEFILPSGASRYGRGLFAFGRQQMAAIALQLWGYTGDLSTIPAVYGTVRNSAVLRIEYGGQAFQIECHGLPPMLLDGSGENGLWLLPIVDSRYFFRKFATGSPIQPGGWAPLLGPIAGQTVPQAYGIPDPAAVDKFDAVSNLANPDGNLWDSLIADVAALSTGFRWIFTHETGAVDPRPSSPQDSDYRLNENLAAIRQWAGGAVGTSAPFRNVEVVSRLAVDHSDQCGNLWRAEVDVQNQATVPQTTLAKPKVWCKWFTKAFRQDLTTKVEAVVDDANFNAFARRMVDDVTAWGQRQYSFSVPGVAAWKMTGWDDYISYRVGGIDNLDAVSTHIQSLPPDFYPLVNICQDPTVYIHPTPSMLLTLREDMRPNGWAECDFLHAAGSYQGEDRRPILARVVNRECLPPLRECDQVWGHYYCGTDPPLPNLNATFPEESGEPGWIINTFQQALPAWEIEAELDESLLASDPSGVAEFRKIRSTFPHVDKPPGIDEDGKIQFANPWKVDGICESPVILQLVSDPCRPVVDENGDPYGSCGYTEGGDPQWEIREAARKKARKVLFRFSPGGDPAILDWWDGENPESCGANFYVIYPLGVPCNECDVLAYYAPLDDLYIAHATRSAMLGEPETLNMVQSIAYDEEGCGINYIQQPVLSFPCGSEPSLIEIEPMLQSLDVVTDATLIPPVPTCTGECRLRWNWTVSQWEIVEHCQYGCECTFPSGFPPPDVPNPEEEPLVEVTYPCENFEGQSPSPGFLQFDRASILVCGYNLASPRTILLAECPDPEEEP